MLKKLLGLHDRASAGRAAYDLAVSRARDRAFYVDHGVEDRIDARFELYTLHVLLLVLRLRDEDTTEGRDAAQDLFDTYVSALDNTLRELGVGDVEREAFPASHASKPFEPVTRDTTRLGLLQLVGKDKLRPDVEAISPWLSLCLLNQNRLSTLHGGGERDSLTITLPS